MRIEFTETTKKILSGRAGYQCSHPDCDMVTIGPGDRFDQTSSVGEAAHIYSAAKKGPRGQSGLTEAQLKSVNNGIWLCKTHARLIDVNKGDGFTANQLISWKRLHEEAIKRRQGRIHRNVGWISRIKVIESPVFKEDTVIELGKVTLLESSKNAAGKTAVCEWLSVVSSECSPERWIPSRRRDTRYAVDLFTPERHEVCVSIVGDEYHISVDGVDTPFCGLSFKSFFFSNELYKIEDRDSMKDSELLCKMLGVDIHTLKKLFLKLGFSDYSKIKKVTHIDDENEINNIECTLKNRNFSLSFKSLSDGESDSVIFELLIAKMQSLAEFSPLILFIEASETSFDNLMISEYLDFLNSSEIMFQTIVTSLSSKPSKPNIGVAHFFLEGAVQDVAVGQV